ALPRRARKDPIPQPPDVGGAERSGPAGQLPWLRVWADPAPAPGVAENPPPEKPRANGSALLEPEPDEEPNGSSGDESAPPGRESPYRLPNDPWARFGWTKPGSKLVAEPSLPVVT